MPREFAEAALTEPQFAWSRSILYADNFDGYRIWTETGTGADFVVDTTNSSQYNGTEGFVLSTRATDSAEDDVVTAARFISYPDNDHILLRMRVGIPDVSTVKRIQINLQFVAEGKVQIPGILIYPNSPTLSYFNSAGTVADVADSDQVLRDGFWTTLQFNIDLATKMYKDVFYNGMKFDLSDQAMLETNDPNDYRDCKIQLSVYAMGAAVATAYFDSLLVTQDLNI